MLLINKRLTRAIFANLVLLTAAAATAGCAADTTQDEHPQEKDDAVDTVGSGITGCTLGGYISKTPGEPIHGQGLIFNCRTSRVVTVCIQRLDSSWTNVACKTATLYAGVEYDMVEVDYYPGRTLKSYRTRVTSPGLSTDYSETHAYRELY